MSGKEVKNYDIVAFKPFEVFRTGNMILFSMEASYQ